MKFWENEKRFLLADISWLMSPKTDFYYVTVIYIIKDRCYKHIKIKKTYFCRAILYPFLCYHTYLAVRRENLSEKIFRREENQRESCNLRETFMKNEIAQVLSLTDIVMYSMTQRKYFLTRIQSLKGSINKYLTLVLHVL